MLPPAACDEELPRRAALDAHDAHGAASAPRRVHLPRVVHARRQRLRDDDFRRGAAGALRERRGRRRPGAARREGVPGDRARRRGGRDMRPEGARELVRRRGDVLRLGPLPPGRLPLLRRLHPERHLGVADHRHRRLERTRGGERRGGGVGARRAVLLHHRLLRRVLRHAAVHVGDDHHPEPQLGADGRARGGGGGAQEGGAGAPRRTQVRPPGR